MQVPRWNNPEDTMAKKPITTEEVLDAIDAMEVEELAKVKEAAVDKLEGMKHLVVTQMREQMQKQMALFNLSAADLGFTTGSPAKRSGKPAGERKRAAPSGDCPICQFPTEPQHDGRKHRSQKDDKKPFTDDELHALSLHRVEHANA
jgi:hypothetical protein